ncbi:MAG TPA: cation diffusion facilitator family transporter [Spirochaetota bacterium]|nr:cation diffusion facilitator family transporter [Spirochaetota bacterium]
MSHEHPHSHSHQHHNHNHKEINGNNLLFTIALNFIITIAELIGGFVSGSLSLISDALHNFSDTLGSAISFVAIKISKKSNNLKKTYGYKRVEILAALLNSTILIIISVFLFKEAYERFFNPKEINSILMFIVAVIGFIANLVAVMLLHKDSKKNINIKSAYLHLLGDTLSSVGVIIGAVLIYFFKIYWIDPILTVLIGLYIIKESFEIVKETVNILMQSTPSGINILEIKESIEKIEQVANVHHIHIWQTNEEDIFFEGHIDVCDDIKISQSEILMKKIEEILMENFKINHLTLQVEINNCKNKNLLKN